MGIILEIERRMVFKIYPIQVKISHISSSVHPNLFTVREGHGSYQTWVISEKK